MNLIDKITSVIEPSLDAMGYGLVLVKMADGDRRKTLTVMAERKDGVTMSFDDCTEISRTVGALLEVEDPISGAYNLEVCSPGIDRPLVKAGDFARHVGYEAKLETQLPMEGRKKFRGKIKGLQDNIVTLLLDSGEAHIPLSNIRHAKLVMTDELMAEFLKKQRHTQPS